MPYKKGKTKDGKIIWGISYTPEFQGKTVQQSVGAISYAEAERIELEHRAKYAKSRQAQDPNNTDSLFDNLLLKFLDHVDQTYKGSSRQRAYASAKQLAEYFEGRDLDSLKGQDIHDYTSWRRGHTTQMGTPPNDATISKELGTLRAAINWANRDLDWNIKNFLAGRIKKNDNHRDRWLTQTEAHALIAAASDSIKAPYLAPLIILGLNTGMRKSEILNLEWHRIYLDRRIIVLTSQGTKTNTKRHVYLNDAAIAAINALPRPTDTRWCICDQHGNRINDIKRSYQTAAHAAGLTDIGVHTLRHTCATWLGISGCTELQIAHIIGHKTGTITSRYTHIDDLLMLDLVQRISFPNKKAVDASASTA